MKKSNIIFPIALIFLATIFMAFISEPDDINKALKTGNTEILMQNMNSTVELVILEKENVYSKVQAEQILKQFFSNHEPVSFEILHNGGNESSQYYIGTLKTKRETYRVYYLLKTKDKLTLLYQLRIETDE